MTADELFREGRLDDAVAAQLAKVKAAPADDGARTFLFELSAFAGDLDRAGRQLDTLQALRSDLELAIRSYRDCLAAERERRACFTNGVAPALRDADREELRPRLDALAALCGDDPSPAAELLVPPPPRPALLTLTARGGDRPAAGEPVEVADFRDADDLLAPVLEFFEGPHYRWVPLSTLARVVFEPVTSPRSVLFRGVTLEFADGTERRGFLPGLYPNSHEAEDDAVRLGRTTEWVGFPPADDGTPGPAFGLGGRLFRCGDDGDADERPSAELAEIAFPGST
ncbi:type VI secretion system accessory protein TagJ [Alienimonas californiensis]|uniref:ImpE protein n=1 Tax=Alienimonas californiensis TaxID=2527989 RepID=A0A517P4H4_9PLAN|nr:type VI secretion system accessory protein TagJ [Alienimonas californiensis]QDT14261.1 ImpE protein [Alienimonas californiensis]